MALPSNVLSAVAVLASIVALAACAGGEARKAQHMENARQFMAERDYEGAEVVLVSYGAVSRAARMAANLAREQGLPVGTLRLITPWPFPGEEIEEMARKAKKVIVLENNLGQLYPFIKAEAACHADVSFLPPRVIGEIQDPEAILERIREVLK